MPRVFQLDVLYAVIILPNVEFFHIMSALSLPEADSSLTVWFSAYF